MKVNTAWLAVLCILFLAGCRQPGFPSGSNHQASSHLAPLPVGSRQVSPGKYVGVYEKSAVFSYKSVERFAAAAGQSPDLALYFSGWGEDFRTAFALQAQRHHATPLVQINPTNVSMSKIARGAYDAYLIRFASEVRSFGHPVVVGFAHEMNGWWYSWGYRHTSPKVWVAAWRHVVTVFREQGASNVTWLWTIDRNPGARRVIPEYWPGASYVDWVGIDGYYFKPADTFASIFAPIIDTVRKITKKPILLAETGIGQVAGQAQKIPDLFAGVREYHLLGLVWYDVDQHQGLYHQDWRLEGHPAAIAAFRRGVAGLRR